MEHTATETPTVSEAVRAAITDSVGSVRAAAIQSGIAYTTLDRRLRGDGSDFSVNELRRLAVVTDRRPSDFGVDAA
jgi:hypothetical protein